MVGACVVRDSVVSFNSRIFMHDGKDIHISTSLAVLVLQAHTDAIVKTGSTVKNRYQV